VGPIFLYEVDLKPDAERKTILLKSDKNEIKLSLEKCNCALSME